ncbi:MAG: YitT family protein [Chloroflexota bacterium]
MRDRILAGVAQLDYQQVARNYFWLTIGVILSAITFHMFLNAADIAPGGVSGLTLIINEFTGWPNGLILFVLQVPMIFLGFFYLGRMRFVMRAFYLSVAYSGLVTLFEQVWPRASLTDDPLLNVIFGAVIGGIGTGLIFRGRATMAGTSIISRIIQLKTGLPASQLYLMVDGGIIIILGLVFGWENALYAFMMLFLWGLATDYVMEGPSVIRTAFIVTDHPRKLADALLHRTGLGVTAWEGKGMFTDREHTILFCTVRRPDVDGLRATVSEVDPKAFLVIGQGHRARGGVMREAVQ